MTTKRKCEAALCSVLLLMARAALARDAAFEQDASLPLVYLNVIVETGSVSDPEGLEGITHFTGEMLLRGSTGLTKAQFDHALDTIGARLDVECRAEALILRGAVLSSSLPRFLELLTAVVTRPAFSELEMLRLKAEVTSGILEELSHDASLGALRFNSFLFQGHPYGKPVIGTVSSVRSFTLTQVRDQYERLFRDRRLLVLGSGDVDPKIVEEWARSLAAARPGGDAPPKIPAPENASRRRLLIVDKPGQTQTEVFGGQIGIRMTDRDFFPLFLGNHVFGGGSFSSRLMAEIRVKRGWSYGAESHFRFGREPRYWSFHFTPANKDTPAATGLALQLERGFKDQGVTTAEFSFARQSLVNSAAFMLNTPQKRVENLILEKTLELPEGFMRTYGPQIEKVALDEVNKALKRFLKPEQVALTVVGDAKTLRAPLAAAIGVQEQDVKVMPYRTEN